MTVHGLLVLMIDILPTSAEESGNPQIFLAPWGSIEPLSDSEHLLGNNLPETEGCR